MKSPMRLELGKPEVRVTTVAHEMTYDARYESTLRRAAHTRRCAALRAIKRCVDDKKRETDQSLVAQYPAVSTRRLVRNRILAPFYNEVAEARAAVQRAYDDEIEKINQRGTIVRVDWY